MYISLRPRRRSSTSVRFPNRLGGRAASSRLPEAKWQTRPEAITLKKSETKNPHCRMKRIIIRAEGGLGRKRLPYLFPPFGFYHCQSSEFVRAAPPSRVGGCLASERERSRPTALARQESRSIDRADHRDTKSEYFQSCAGVCFAFDNVLERECTSERQHKDRKPMRNEIVCRTRGYFGRSSPQLLEGRKMPLAEPRVHKIESQQARAGGGLP